MVVATTKRLAIHRHTIDRGDVGCSRDVYQAWSRVEDIPRPICVVTLWKGYVEWISTDELHRQQGYAVETLNAIESLVGSLEIEGVTDSGIALTESIARKKDDELNFIVDRLVEHIESSDHAVEMFSDMIVEHQTDQAPNGQGYARLAKIRQLAQEVRKDGNNREQSKR